MKNAHIILVALLVITPVSLAGSLNPSGPVAPTMKTLDEVEPRIPLDVSGTTGIYIPGPGSYYLTGDFTSNTFGLSISGSDSNITIDLMGYTITGTNSAYKGIIINSGAVNVEIRNGTVTGFSKGVDGPGADYCRIVGVRAIGNSAGGIYLSGQGNQVTGCVVADNGTTGVADGIDLGSAAVVSGNNVYDCTGIGIDVTAGAVVTGNTVYNCDGSGIEGSSGCSFSNNTTYNNGVYGLYASTGSSFAGNTAYSNDNYGIRASGSACVIINNCVYDNGSAVDGNGGGIQVASNSTVRGNALRSNVGFGIKADHGNTIIDNTVNDTEELLGMGNGIDALNGCTISRNTLRNAGGLARGIETGACCTIRDNVVKDFQLSGIWTSDSCTIVGNTVCSNLNHGIYVTFGCTIAENTVISNANDAASIWYGIRVSSDCYIRENNCNNNGDANIYLYSTDNALVGNVVTDSSGWGIDFNGNGNFYKDNRASGNASGSFDNSAGQTSGGGNYSY